MALNGYFTVVDVAREVALDLSDYTESRAQKYQNWALRLLQDFTLKTSYGIKSQVFTLSNIGTLNFSDINGYVDWSKIGTINGDRITVFSTNKDIIKYHPTISGIEQPNKPYNSGIDLDNDGSSFLNTWWGNKYVGSYYGLGQGGEHNKGQFDVDTNNGRFQFSTEWANKDILIEYITTNINQDGATVLPERFRSMFIEYIKFQYYLSKKDLSMAREHERMYDSQLIAVERREINFSISDIIWWARESHLGVPKT